MNGNSSQNLIRRVMMIDAAFIEEEEIGHCVKILRLTSNRTGYTDCGGFGREVIAFFFLPALALTNRFHCSHLSPAVRRGAPGRARSAASSFPSGLTGIPCCDVRQFRGTDRTRPNRLQLGPVRLAGVRANFLLDRRTRLRPNAVHQHRQSRSRAFRQSLRRRLADPAGMTRQTLYWRAV